MKRTQIQLDEATYDALRRRAFDEGRSISAVARSILAEALGSSRPGADPPLRIEDFTFIASGRSRRNSKARPTSVHHDEALAEDLYESHRGRS